MIIFPITCQPESVTDLLSLLRQSAEISGRHSEGEDANTALGAYWRGFRDGMRSSLDIATLALEGRELFLNGYPPEARGARAVSAERVVVFVISGRAAEVFAAIRRLAEQDRRPS